MDILSDLKVKIFADGADRDGIMELYSHPLIQGFTTNPTLMRKAGISDYEAFGRGILQEIRDRPISFEVFADDFEAMEAQAMAIASWGDNVYVKLPVTTTDGEHVSSLAARLSARGVKLNITAIMTADQVKRMSDSLCDETPSLLSVFAGRIADTGRDPIPILCESLAIARQHSRQEIVWASPREILNIFQADSIGCHVITVTHDLLKKLSLVGKDLADYSLETVMMFRRDAVACGFQL